MKCLTVYEIVYKKMSVSMNLFDEKQVSLLTSFVKNDVILHYSFFANTFPLAYHYNMLLKKHKKNPQKHIMSHEWDEYFPSKSSIEVYRNFKQLNAATEDESHKTSWYYPEKVNIFYSSQINYKTEGYKKDDPYSKIEKELEVFDDNEKIEYVKFTDYRPRLIFVRKNVFLECLKDVKKEFEIDYDNLSMKGLDFNQLISFRDFLPIVKRKGYNNLVVYSETINEFKDIIEEYDFINKCNIGVNYKDAHDFSSLYNCDSHSKKDKREILLFFYGAPISFHLLTKPEKYVPLKLEEEMGEMSITSNACIHYNVKNHKKNIDKISSALKQYHKQLFDIARSHDGGEYLNNIRLAYNEYSRLKRHDSYFYTSESFRRCIYEYHLYGQPLSDNKLFVDHIDPKCQEGENNEKNKIHIHYGAGKLGIGLVLNTINKNNNCPRQIIVVQKYRPTWQQKIHFSSSKMNGITLQNDKGWKMRVRLLNSNDFSSAIAENSDAFILCKDLKSIESLFLCEKLSSISYSLGDHEAEKEFLEFLSTLRNQSEIMLYPFENKPFDVNENKIGPTLKNILEKNERLFYVMIKADRICPNRKFKPGNVVEIEVENHCEIVFNIDREATDDLFDQYKMKNELVFTSDQKIFDFYSDRKKFLLNELHFILAVYGFYYLKNKGIYSWNEQYVPIIQAVLRSDYDYKIKIDAFIDLQILRLIRLHGQDLLVKLYDIGSGDINILYERLRGYAENTIFRFSESKEDTIKRVFKLDDLSSVQRKYQDIILNLNDFIKKNKKWINQIGVFCIPRSMDYICFLRDIKKVIEEILKSRNENEQNKIDQLQEDLNLKRDELSYYKKSVKKMC